VYIDVFGTYSDDNGGVCCDFGGHRDVHLDVGWVGAEASDLLKSSQSRAGRSQQGECSGKGLHVDVVPLIRFEDFVRGGIILTGATCPDSYTLPVLVHGA
jgi:hypothetical protein